MTFEDLMIILFEVLAFFGLIFGLVLFVRLVLWCLECSFFASSSKVGGGGGGQTSRDGKKAKSVEGGKMKQINSVDSNSNNSSSSRSNNKKNTQVKTPPAAPLGSTKTLSDPKAQEVGDNVLPLPPRQDKQQQQQKQQSSAENVVLDIEVVNVAEDGDNVAGDNKHDQSAKVEVETEAIEAKETIMIMELPALERSQTLDENVSVYDNVSHRDSVHSEPVSREERLRVGFIVAMGRKRL